MRKSQVVRLRLNPSTFTEREAPILETPSFSVSAFRFKSGVEALRIRAGRGEVVWLPYLGQQVWDWRVDGASLKFEGFVEEPAYGRTFLQNYGGFLIHCGMTAMGNPGPRDTHPHHGELPLAHFDEAWIEVWPDESHREELSLCGHIHWKVPFVAEYHCTPALRISADGLRLRAAVHLENPTSRDLEYMYLAHINFAFSGAEHILSTAPLDAAHAVIREEALPALMRPALASNPALIKRIDGEMAYEPELVATIRHRDDCKGSVAPAGSILVHKDGSARWVRQESPELDHYVIWITHNGDRGACGFHLPATAGPSGFESEKAFGNLKRLPAGGSIVLRYECGFAEKLEDAPIQGAH
jgi:hypothetical protein